MNLEDLTDEQTTTKKMRSALKRGDTKKEVDRLSKKKNPNPNPHGVDADCSTTDDGEITVDAVMGGEIGE